MHTIKHYKKILVGALFVTSSVFLISGCKQGEETTEDKAPKQLMEEIQPQQKGEQKATDETQKRAPEVETKENNK